VDRLDALIRRRRALLQDRADLYADLQQVNQQIITEMQARDITRADGVIVSTRRTFRPFIAAALLDEQLVSTDERAGVYTTVINPEALKEQFPDIYEQACTRGEPYVVSVPCRDEGEGAGAC
jgi:hypothetical protein